MNKETLLSGLVGLVIGIILMWFFAPWWGGMMAYRNMMGINNIMGSIDSHFIEQMIPHHQMAVMMAQMLQQSTIRPEMKQLAKDIIEGQTREINSMRDWYRQWYGQ